MGETNNILYLNNYMLDDIIQQRKNVSMFFQSANNKIDGLRSALNYNNCNVYNLSSGLVNCRSGKLYRSMTSTIKEDLYYCSIIDFPGLNTISSIISMFLSIWHMKKKIDFDYIIFYNFKPEVAIPAYLAQKFLGIPIIIDYEDDYDFVEGVSPLKKYIFSLTKKLLLKKLSGAIVVNSKLQQQLQCKSVLARGVIQEKFLNKSLVHKKQEHSIIRLLYAGRLDKERGIEVLLKSLAFCPEDFELTIIGSGPMLNLVKECTDKRVSYKGYLPYGEVENLMLEADILIQCQLCKHQFSAVSFPSKLFEYITTGNCIISSSIEEVKEFSNNGFIFYYNDDPKELAHAIEQGIKEVVGKQRSAYYEADLLEDYLPRNIGKKILSMLYGSK